MKTCAICVVAFMNSQMSMIEAKKHKTKQTQEDPLVMNCPDLCPDTIPDYRNKEKCDDKAFEGCMCTYDADTANPFESCHLLCDIDGTWSMTCLRQRFAPGNNDGGRDNKSDEDDQTNKSADENELCTCPNKNPLEKTNYANTCDGDLWGLCRKTCTYDDESGCKNVCVGNEWVEECVEHFDSHSTLSCENGRCSLSEECQIPRDGYSITGQHLSGMLGEYLLTPDGCTGSCTGCVLSSSGRSKSILISQGLVCASVATSLIVMLFS